MSKPAKQTVKPKPPTADIIIALNEDGGCDAVRIPDNTTVEIRDYNVPKDWEGEVFTDDDGKTYQRVTLKG